MLEWNIYLFGSSSINLGDEGGFVPLINTPDEALNIIEQAIINAKLEPNKDIFLALDCAASEFYNKNTKLYNVESNLYLTNGELVNYYSKLIKNHPALISIEDPFDETDYYGWQLMMTKYNNKIMIVGDDLLTTNSNLVKQCIRNEWANSLLLKVNQIGTISEAVESAKLMQTHNFNVIVSHRSGETTSTLIADLAVAIGAKYVKFGGLARGERICKYNRLLSIENII